MGITFLEYQNELRLSYIYRDLINTEDLVAEILERHGFANYKLFRRMFKARFGDTPLKVRARLKTKKDCLQAAVFYLYKMKKHIDSYKLCAR